MTAIDGTGLHALEHFADVLHASGRTLILCGMRDQPARMMERVEFHQHIGDENLAPTIEAALRRARGLLRADDDRRIQAAVTSPESRRERMLVAGTADDRPARG